MPRRPPGPSTKPALIVIGIAAVVLVMGAIGAALTSSGSTRPAPTTSLRTARGAGITAVPGRRALGPIVIVGQPPGDILDAVAMPKGATVKAGSATNNGIGLYDHSLSFSIGVERTTGHRLLHRRDESAQVADGERTARPPTAPPGTRWCASTRAATATSGSSV